MSKKQRKRGKRHSLLLYRRTMDRLWGITVLLGLVLFALWWYGRDFTLFYRPGLVETLVLLAAVLSLGVGIFAFVARFLSFVQPNEDHLLIATPFFRLKTSYRRVVEVRSIEFRMIVPFDRLSWAYRTYLDPFIGETVVVVRLRSYPVPPWVLKLFFPRFMLFPEAPGFVLVVPDWMKLSVELDSRYSGWRQRLAPRPRVPGFQRGMRF